LGLGLYHNQAAIAAALAMVIALVFLFVSVIHYIREIRVALSSVQDEARDLKFMDLGQHPEMRGPSAM
jgi:hypothetical protein